MKLAEYAAHDALGLAELVAKKQVTPKELALTAASAIAKGQPEIGAIVELWAVEHTEEPIQGLPFVFCGLSFAAILTALLRPQRTILMALRVVMALMGCRVPSPRHSPGMESSKPIAGCDAAASSIAAARAVIAAAQMGVEADPNQNQHLLGKEL